MIWMAKYSRKSQIIRGFVFLVLLFFAFANYHQAKEKQSGLSTPNDQFKAYWYQGKAELTRYALEQARYGEIHKGDAVLIFVTEDFLNYEQVKKEFDESKNYSSVLKLNFTRKFYTGLYPYSTMVSVFTPVDLEEYPKTLKVTSSNQEWCGHTFTQFNLRGRKYKVQLRSYFQDEADQDFTLKPVFLEDEIWTRIRISPESLPVGDIEIIPGLTFSRLRHVKNEVQKATTNLVDLMDESLSRGELQAYSVDYKDLERQLTIKFEKAFPHRIVAWEETTSSGFGRKAKSLTTLAVRTHSVQNDYWTKHSLVDSTYRKQLGLE